MEILELVLKHYGKFDNHRIVLKPGINIIYGGNETGKTTIHSFIRSMFFGLNRGRGKAARNDEYQIRQPWDTPGAFLGSMRIQENGEIYRIDRCFDRSTRPLQVVCETRMQESANPEEDLNVLLGGISENAFVNTVFVRQAQAETDEAFAEELRKYMVNSENTMDAGLDVTQALQSLRKRKKTCEQKRKKEEEQLDGKIEAKQTKAENIRSELELLKQQLEVYHKKGIQGNYESETGSGGSRNYSVRRDDLEETEEWEDDWSEEKSGRGRWILEILLLLAGVTALVGALLLQEKAMKLFLGIFAGIFFVMIPIVYLLMRGSRSVPEEMPHLTQEEERQIGYLTGEIRKREEAYQTLTRELEEIYRENVRLDGADTEIAALNLAIDRICELTAGIYEKSGGQLNERASQILNEITGGRYNRLVLDELSEVRIHTPSKVMGLHQVSGGTMQQIYFALRMAAGELLGEGTGLPLILDETFALYDDERLEAALRWLKRSGRQVILFTCQKREREILRRLEND